MSRSHRVLGADFVVSPGVVATLQELQASRSRSGALAVGQAGGALLTEADAADLPVLPVDKSLEPHVPYASSISGGRPWELPKLALEGTTPQKPVDVRLRFVANQALVGQEVAELVVGLRILDSQRVARQASRRMPFRVAVSIRYWLQVSGAASEGSWFEHEFGETVSTDTQVRAKLAITSAAMLSRLYAAMTRAEHKCHLVIRLKATMQQELWVPQPVLDVSNRADLGMLRVVEPSVSASPLRTPAVRLDPAILRSANVHAEPGLTVPSPGPTPASGSAPSPRPVFHVAGPTGPVSSTTGGGGRSPQLHLAPAGVPRLRVSPSEVHSRPLSVAPAELSAGLRSSVSSPMSAGPASPTRPVPSPVVMPGSRVVDSFAVVANPSATLHASRPDAVVDFAPRLRSDLAAKLRLHHTASVYDVRDRHGSKVHVAREKQSVATMDFLLDRGPFGYVYEVLGETAFDEPARQVLTVHVVHDKRFFQDGVSDVFYYLPDAFLLARTEHPPHEPMLLVGFKEVILEGDAEGDATVSYVAEVSFWTRPVIASEALAAARRELPSQNGPPVLLPLDGAEASLRVHFVGGPFSGTPLDAEVSLVSGARATVELSAGDFAAFFTSLTRPNVAAIQGVVTSRAVPGAPVNETRLSISFFEPSSHGLEIDLARRIEGTSRYAVTIRNNGGTSVRIDGVRTATTADGAQLAHRDPPFPMTLTSYGSAELTFDGPAGAAAALDISLDLEVAVVSVDLERLWPRLVLTAGYATWGRKVLVRVEDPDFYFGVSPDPAVGPLTALRVEFFREGAVTLTSIDSSAEVWLRNSLLDELLGRPTSDSFMYRVVNVHGAADGAASGWQEARGDSLFVVAAG